MGLKSWLTKVLQSTTTTGRKAMENVYSVDACLASTNASLAECGLTKADIKEFRLHSTLAGSVKEKLERFALTQERVAMIWGAIVHVVVWEELILFFLLGFVLPLMIRKRQKKKAKQEAEQNKGIEQEDHQLGRHFFVKNISQMAQVALVVYLVDIFKLVLLGVGFEFTQSELPHAIGNILYMAWVLNRVSALKRFLLAKQTKTNPDDLKGQVQLVDRVIDAVLYFMALYISMDAVKEDMGAPARGILAMGSVGTFVFSLASQGLATQLFNGLFLASSNRMAVGDHIKCSNGVAGCIMKLGWMETIIRGSDEVLTTVPNKDLADQRVANLSRGTQCAVKQTLRFKYSDIDKLPAVLESIKEEIKKSCPELISDGKRPFRAVLTGYHSDHISAVVDCRFKLKPIGNPFFENQQNALLAIARAVKQHDVKFAVVDLTALSTALQVIAEGGSS